MLNTKRDAIISAATDLFLERGFDDVSMDTIASKADVSKRTIYSHFENKEILFEAIMSAACGCISSRSAIFDNNKYNHLPVAEFLYRFGDDYLRAIVEPKSIALYRAIVSQAARFPKIGRQFYEFGPSGCIDKFSKYLEQKSQVGELVIEDPVRAATQFLSMLDMIMHMQLSTCVRDSYSSEEIQSQVFGTVDTFLKAFGKA